ncbi:MAG: radical SAM protein, partial [Bacteroidaceae bacterium]|nr:radical SAM protein [Bacteroidaceae bacterium]
MSELKADYITLGCKLNFAETSSLSDKLQACGIRRVTAGENADICVINTCTVTETSNHKCRQAINRALREHPGTLMVVMGCYAQLAARQIAMMPGVDLVISMEHKSRAVELILQAYEEKCSLCSTVNGQRSMVDALHHYEEVALRDIRTFVPSCSHGERTRFFLKVQDGCDYFCTYCAIPLARGRSRNGSVASIVAQAQSAAEQGAREIVITGVNIGDFGKSTGETFFDLVKALDQVEGIGRYRISSIEPNLLTEKI